MASKQKSKKAGKSIGKKQRKVAGKAICLTENSILHGQRADSAPAIDQTGSIKPAPSSQIQRQSSPKQSQQELLPFDKTLLDRARTQWQFGDWSSLTKLKASEIEHHPDCAKLAMLIAAGQLQTDQFTEARSFIALARDRGIDKKTCIQILVSGVYNSLGRAAAIGNQQHRALQHFENAIQIGAPGSDANLLTQARTGEQLGQLDFRATNGYQKVEALERPLAPLKTIQSAPTPEPAPPKQAQKFSSDADIDDFIEDISPFFRNRAIVYVDVGAYIGEVFTKLLAFKKIKIREAHLIEPNPESYRKLQDAAKASKMQACNTYHMGISNHPGTAKFKAAQSMTKRVQTDISSEKSSNIFEAECCKLDDIAELFADKHVHLMKLDVEGEELDVLKSAEQLLKEQRIDVLYVEVGFNRHGTQQTYFGDLDAVLQSYGYRVFRIYEQKNEWIDDSPLLRRCNAAYMSSQFEAVNPYTQTLKQ